MNNTKNIMYREGKSIKMFSSSTLIWYVLVWNKLQKPCLMIKHICLVFANGMR